MDRNRALTFTQPSWWRRTSLAQTLRAGSAMAAIGIALSLLTAPVAITASLDEHIDVPASIQLAQAFMSSLNEHDVDRVVEMFTDEDSGPTVNADAYAWEKFEIRLWAQRQALQRIHVTGYDFQVTEHGATWNADVFRDDWQEWGVDLLPVSNSIWVHDGRIANFTSVLRDPSDARRLSSLWEPTRGVQR
jgi:hypothetical protein